ncbi:MAG: restriction endonuclease subunit S [Ignavibacteria bacterium]|nr:restriction endonuclease subunit S [Ignavibacteria bacterium]
MILSDNRRTTLGAIADFTNGGAWSQTEYSASGVPVVRVTDIKGETVDLTDCKFLPKTSIAKYERHLLKAGDLLICTVGSHPTQPGSVVGRAAVVPTSAQGALLNQNAVRIRSASPDVDQVWLSYLGRSALFHSYIIGCARGSANQVRMAIGLLKEMIVEVPLLADQQRIAGILSAYDDLIENCQRRIKILESMARTLYREWFVHFRFPGHENHPLVASPLGEIPEGWEVRKLGEIAEEMRRNVAKGQLEEPRPFVGLEHIPRRSIALDAWETSTDLGSNKLEFKKGEILFGKIRPYFHKVSVAPFDGLCSADVIVIRSRLPELYAIVAGCVSSDEFVALATATSNGSKMPRANWRVLEERLVTIPTSTVAEQFSAVVEPAFQQMQALIFQIQNLRRTRDLLLPRLLSGQLILLTYEERI